MQLNVFAYECSYCGLLSVDITCSIGDNWSFDDEVAAKYGCIVRAFDPRLALRVINLCTVEMFINNVDVDVLNNAVYVSYPVPSCNVDTVSVICLHDNFYSITDKL